MSMDYVLVTFTRMVHPKILHSPKAQPPLDVQEHQDSHSEEESVVQKS